MHTKNKLQGVSAVIPSYNCKKNVFRLIDSLKKTNYPDIEVVVVDNGSKDGTFEEGKKKFKWVRWVNAGEKNIGQTGCYNLGFALAKKGNHLMMIDSDVVVEKDMVLKLVNVLEEDPLIGIVTPLILYLNDKNWVNQAGANVNLYTGKVSIGWGPKEKFLQRKKVQNSGTVMLFRNSVIKKIGGFEDWFMCYFDPDFCLRAKKAGYITWYEPSAVAYHDQSKDPKVWGPRVLSRAYLLGRNRTLFMRRHSRNILIYILFLPFLLFYYLIESIKFGIFPKWLELVGGSFIGFFYPLKKGNYIPTPVASLKK
ncbi:MAG: glycosyltransferase family 2 protein [Patescibacteria group bacterium]|nr:glycosyltransferase family 2 protein [Patescibacteria group bacterium]